MKKILSILLPLPFFLLSGCQGQDEKVVVGNGHQTTQSRAATSFDQVRISAALRLQAVVGKASSIKIEADSNLLPYVITSVNNHVLTIKRKPGFEFEVADPITVIITTKQLNSLNVSGASRAVVSGIQANKFSCNLSGASRGMLQGKSDALSLSLSGASKLNAGKLSAGTVTGDLSGASRATVNVSHSLQTSVSGASTLYYSGSPRVVQNNTSGSGKVIKAD